jgi:hypothetical protein
MEKPQKLTFTSFFLLLAITLLLSGQEVSAAFRFSPPAPLNTNATTDVGVDFYPQLATDDAGNWVAVWASSESLGSTIGTDYDILVSRSANHGLTWTAPAALNTTAASDSTLDVSPYIETDGAGTWIAIWSSNNTLGSTIGSDYDVLFARSTNNGATWSAPAALSASAALDSEGETPTALKTDGAGNWIAVVHSDETLGIGLGTDLDILFARSTDNGASWSSYVPLNTNAATDAGDDQDACLATDGLGNWVALWTSKDSLGGTIGLEEDILISRSSDHGTTWTAPVALNSNAASDAGRDVYPTIATDAAGNWVALWQSNDSLGGTIGIDGDMIVSRSTNNGATWTALAALSPDAASDPYSDTLPALATDGAGNWIAVWQTLNALGEGIGSDQDIFVSRSTNNGAAWTLPAPLNTNATHDSGFDASPQIATGAGSWVVAWYSTDTLDNTIHIDNDILFSRTSSLDPTSVNPGTWSLY